MGAAPPEEEELAALRKKTYTLKGPPYADFAVFTPFGRRCLKAQKPLGDGSFLMRELPGPQNWMQWLSSWRVYKQLSDVRHCESGALQLYEKHLERLTMQWPNAGG